MSKVTIHALINALTGQIGDRPDAATLAGILERIDSRAFALEIKEYRRGLNDPDALNDFEDDVLRFRRDIERLRAALDYDRQQLGVIGIGMGVALVGGGIIAAVSIAVPPLALLPIAAGGMVLGTSYSRGKQISREIALCDQMIERLKGLQRD